MSVIKFNQVHRHYKGGRYVPMMLASNSEDRKEKFVIYMSLEKGEPNARPLKTPTIDSWLDIVEWPDGRNRQRFVPESELDNINSDLGKLETIWASEPSCYNSPGV